MHTDFSRKDDYPTQRDMKEPVPSGAAKGFKIEKDKFDKLLNEYYDLHGWDTTTGFPNRETLLKMQLEQVLEDLIYAGKIH